MSTWPSLGLLLLATLLLQVSLAEDLYWEGEEDASNEFLEVKEDNSIVGHLKRFKRQWNEDPPSPENEVNTEDPINNDDLDDEGTEGSGSAPETPRIESDNRVETENSGEKTLRVTFVVVQPYEEKYSNRDSPQFQQFSKTLAQAVNVLFDNLPGTQKASLIRIQSRPTDNFSCKVTLDIVTIGYDDTARIKQTLKEHISTYQYLGDVAVKDEDFSANEVNPGSAIETCTADQIPCDDGACIFRGNRCDGIQHCSDNSDELGCGVDERIVTSQQQNTVESNPEPECSERIPCASSSVTICRNQICDGKPDCPLGDDEKNCRVPPQGPERGDQSLFTTPPVSDIYQEVPETTPYYPPAQTCRPGEFRCDENRCILQSSVCDGRNDCFDGTDELSATCPETCGKGDFICENKRCIEGWRQCNHVSDCPNGEDERDCPCRDEEFRCVADGVCIEGRKRCDGVSHCRDGSDELNCACDSDQWQCDQGSCIQRSKRCNGRVDCPSDRSDERHCVAKGHFKCKSGKIIPESLRCNRRYDCPNGDYSDEKNCPCGDDDFKCKNGYCIAKHKRCDKTRDCQDGSDELWCSYGKECMAYEFKCTSGQCVHAESRCNGTAECDDKSDEIACPCKRGQFRCGDGSCINIALRCDGHKDCRRGEDETNCGETRCPEGSFTCGSGSVQCATQCDGRSECENGEDELECGGCSQRCDGRCLEDSKICDNHQDCSDGSDEQECDLCDGPNDFRCKSNNDCIDARLRCNGISECADGSDEHNCNETMIASNEGCLESQFRCRDGQCINADFSCDNHDDCYDGSDEENCPWHMMRASQSPSLSPCFESEFTCNEGRCIPYERRCDNYYDCSDFSDEQNCYAACKYNEYPCVSGGCIPEYLKCNEQEDCPDGSDEINCESIPLVPSLTTEYSPGTSTEAYVPGRRDGQPSLPDYNGVRPTYSPFSPGSGSGSNNNIPPYETPSTTRSPPYYPPEDPNAGRAPSTYSPIPGGNGQDPNGVGGGGFGQGGQPDYPGGSGGPNGWGGSGQRGPNYPGGNSGQNGWGDSGQGGPNYPGGNGGQNGGDGSGQGRPINYPGGNGGQNGWGDFGQGGPINYPGGNGGQSGGGGSGQGRPINYPGGNGGQNGWGDSGQGGPINYPGGNGGQSGGGGSGQGGPINYPSGNGGQNGGGGSGEGVQPIYPGGSGDANGDGSYYQGRYPSSNDGGQSSSGSQIGGGSARGGSLACRRDEWRCENGPCIDTRRRCDGRVDCPFDSSDELDCPSGTEGPVVLNVTTHPNQQTVRYANVGGDVVFRCRDEGPLRAPVRWVREFGRSLKPGAKDRKGRLELEKVTAADAGVYICQTPNYLGRPGSEVRVVLTVQNDRTTTLSPGQCKPYEATCANFECIPKSAVCDGHYDCSDKSDEDMCTTSGRCEPNQFQCDNNKCVLKTWLCDSENDCGDGSDERSCGAAQPGQPCLPSEFSCADGTQCVPKGFHCDGNSDCFDKSDEIGCAPVYIVKPPTPSNLRLNTGDTLTLQAEALGNPIPVISWRLNWGHVPPQCTSTSNNGVGILTCPNMQPEHSGAYSAEALNNKGTTFANPDAIVFVTQTSPCPPGYFNSEARSERECIKCFCFGESKQCRSADLFTYNMPTPLGQGGTRLQGVTITPSGEIRTDASISNHYYYQALRNGATVTKLASYDGISLGSFHPYLSLPETYNGQQLTSYGGHIKYSLAPHSRSAEFDSSAPTVIIQGKYATLFHFHRGRDSSVEIPVEVRLTPENWEKPGRLGFEPASREDIMMALDQIKIILIRADLNNGGVNITNFVMESAQHINIGLGAANLVEECTCPAGYEGLSCQKCSAGYVREMTGAWLGNCVREQCPPGTYGDPATGLACKPCPCPLTTSSNQFARTCAIVSDGRVSCDCNPGYEGRNCEKCAPGYEGNPTIYGDSCRPRVVEQCNGAGTATTRLLGECVCKDNVQGRYCDQCKNNSFFLSNDFRQGCALCFCSGVSQQCMSSNFRRKTTSVNFNIPNIVNEVKIYNSTLAGSSAVAYGAPAETQLKPVLTGAGLTIRGYDRSTPTVLYWSMPLSFAGDMVTAYGGYLRYKMENVQSKFRVKYSTAADVQLISLNHLTFQYSGNFEPLDGRLDATVQFLEKGWHRSDGKEISREHFLLALADVKAILIKATYGDSVATPLSASIEIAEPGGTGPPALHVEQCVCPTGYVGTSCEDCAPGYTRSTSGLYLAHCSLCDCNGHSRQCHPETGECSNCMDNTDGPNCESCKPGYDRDNFDNCVAAELPWIPCQCDPRGSIGPCDASGRCTCKANVEGPNCDRCRAGTFGLEARNPDGCIECFCSGATQECHEGNYYTRIAMAAPIIGEDYGGYTLTDLHADSVIKDELVPAFDKSELIYIFTFPPDQDLYWSLPVFPGNRVTSYGGTLSLRQAFKSNENISSESGIDVVLVGDDLSVYWTNPNTLISEQSLAYQVLLTEQGWYRLGTVVPASRSDFMRILKSLRRVLVRATVSRRLISTSIADVSMDTATDAAQPGAPAALGVEVCTCPAGHLGSSCESCAAGYYKDEQDYCTQCPCSGHDCHLESSGQVTCNCRPPYTGPNCAVIAGEPQATSVRPPPPQSTVSIRILNQGIKIHEIGSSVNFTCQAQSRVQNNPLTISWSKEEGYLPQGRYYVDPYAGVLLITNLQYSDNGVYVCSSTDGISTGSEKVTLLVPANPLKPPTVTIDPSVADYYEGDRVELICIATGDPKPSVYWRRTSNRPLPRSGRQEDSRFIIEDAREEDSGEYSCLAKNTAGSHEGIAVVRVSAQPSRQPRDRLTVSPQAPNVNEGQSMRVVCTGSTSVPAGTIDWVRQDNTRFQSNVRSDNGVLYIDVATRENQGVYICQTQAGDVDPYPVLVTVTPLYIPPVGQQSNISVSANNLNIASGESGTIECKPFGYPLPRITWSKHEGRFGVGVSQRGNTLIVNNAEESDAGYYVCKGFVEGNSKPIGIIYVNVAIERREAPRVQIWPEGFQPATLGSTFEFQCRILAGIPEPDVTWSRTNGRSLSQDTHIKPNNILRFDRVDVNDEGEYICTGNNVMGTSSASAALKVRSLPEIRITPKNVLNVRIGEQLFMECRASGYPQPQITIRGPDRRELAPATVGIATIRVSAASEQDDGEYACVATNEAGTREESFVVRVYRGDAFSDSDGSGEVDVDAGYPETTYPPQIDSNDRDPPSDRLIEYPVPEGENRTVINCPANGFKARWDRSDDKPLQRNAVEEGNNLVIYNISSSDSGEYVCNIYNPQTDVVQVARYIRLRVLPAPRITLRPERQKVNPGMTATVECIVEGDDIRSIQWMPLNRNPSRRIEYRNTMLIFHQIEAEDAGQYQCIAKNSYASASKTAEVIVEEHAEMETSVSHENEQWVRVGATIMLSCNLSAPGVTVSWTKDGQSLPRISRVRPQPDGSLTISFVQKADSGHYVCYMVDANGRITTNYTNLHIEGIECLDTEFRCTDDSNCLDTDMLCDGFDDCNDRSDEENCLRGKRHSSHWTRLDTKAQLITIDPVRSQYITGENVEITCRSSSRDIKWVKYGTNQFVDSKKFGGGAMLVIHSVTIGDAGVYRCTATDLYGKRSFQDFNLEVQPGPSYPSYPSEHEPEREPNQPARYTARLGQLVEMPCHHDLYGPVNINWRRDYTPMQSNVRSDQPILYLNDVSEADAGTYICRVSNNQVALETRAILRVVGVVPKFGGDGWVALPTILDAYRQVDIEVSFKPGDSNGLILYNSERAGRNAGDFLALQLEDGFPQFILETGDGNSIYVTGDRPLTLNTWHTIRLNRIGSQVTMDVDNNGPFKNATADDLILELREPLYVGGVYNLADLPPQLAGASGFVGCVSMLIVRHEEMNLMTNNINRQNVNECDSCAPNPCQNDGVCQEARNERGFTCICLNGYAGERCARRGEGCRPALCGPGRCHDTPSGYKCECPVTHTGRNCENTQSVEYPAFSGSGYLALDPPESKRYFKMSLKVKPTSPVQDGIIMYCAESQRGLGGFTSLAIKNQRLEFRYDLNDGNPMVIVSNITIPARVWTDIQITRSGNVISLTINAVHTYELRQESANKSLNFNTAMFVGGVDEKITVNNNTGVRGGFNGCIKDVEFQNKATDIAKSHNYSGNVQDCNMIDQDERGDVPNENPCLCKNGGTCNADGSCSCPYGTSGYQCENTRQRRGPGPDPCAAHPCRNGGSCKPDYSNMMNHSCDCPLGFSGATCQMDLPLHEMVSFKGDGYLEMPGKLMDYEKDDEPAIMAIAVTTTQNGVLIYQTGLKNERDDFGTTEDEEFVLLRIDRGFVVLEWDMGSGPTSLSVDSKIVTDGERHQVIVRFLSENNVDLTVDDHTVHGTTNGVGNYLNLDSSIYVGGIPSHLNHRELPGLAGCIEQLEFMSMRRALVLGEHAIGGKNTQRCRYFMFPDYPFVERDVHYTPPPEYFNSYSRAQPSHFLLLPWTLFLLH